MRASRLIVLFLACAVPAAHAQDKLSIPESRVDRDRMRAIDRGLDYLAEQQRKDGTWGSPSGGMLGITSLCLLAFLAQGHQEGRGKYAAFGQDEQSDVLRKGIDFLLAHSLAVPQEGKPVGYIWANDGDSRMHGHGYATQVLILAYGSGMTRGDRNRELRLKIQRAIRVIEDSQTITGGWGYQPNHATNHEGSVTVTVVQALRLATNAGFLVDKEVRDRGLKYLRDSQKRDGSFKYSHMQEHSSAALTAAALTAMYGFGEYYSASSRRGLEYLESRYRGEIGQIQWPFYAHYYAAQTLFQSGGSRWRFWKNTGIPHILSEQSGAGYWDDRLHEGARRGSHGRHYATAMSVLALSVQDGYLPLFQR